MGKENYKRREFLLKGTALAAGISVSPNLFHSGFAFGMNNELGTGKMNNEMKRPVHVFTKCLQFLNYEEMAGVLAELGFDGADMTVRPGGQVLPENVETDLPRAVKALRNAGIDCCMITTHINNARDPITRAVLKTMADLGIRYYRMGYLNYDESKTIRDNLEGHRFTFEHLEKINREFGVHGAYQNHSGTGVGAPVWDLYSLLKNFDPQYIGVQYDIRHATVEGGNSWPLGMKLLAPWIKTTDIKDFVWEKKKQGNWIVKDVPLGEGMVDFNSFFGLYKSLGTEGPVSIHYEYNLGGAEHGSLNPSMEMKEIAFWLRKDLLFLKKQFEKFSL
jgi:L-ribulose-5-phosphate 3-epimerase